VRVCGFCLRGVLVHCARFDDIVMPVELNQCGRYLYVVYLCSYPNTCYGALRVQVQAVRLIARMSCPYYHCDILRLCMYVGFLGIATFDDEAIGPIVINVL
jgi:hypothetical protein